MFLLKNEENRLSISKKITIYHSIDELVGGYPPFNSSSHTSLITWLAEMFTLAILSGKIMVTINQIISITEGVESFENNTNR